MRYRHLYIPITQTELTVGSIQVNILLRASSWFMARNLRLSSVTPLAIILQNQGHMHDTELYKVFLTIMLRLVPKAPGSLVEYTVEYTVYNSHTGFNSRYMHLSNKLVPCTFSMTSSPSSFSPSPVITPHRNLVLLFLAEASTMSLAIVSPVNMRVVLGVWISRCSIGVSVERVPSTIQNTVVSMAEQLKVTFVFKNTVIETGRSMIPIYDEEVLV